MAVFHVDSAEVARCAGLVRTSAQTLRAEVAAMMGHLTTLEGSWSGVASTQFSAAAATWRATQVQVEQALDEIGAQLALAATTYDEAETQASALFAGR